MGPGGEAGIFLAGQPDSSGEAMTGVCFLIGRFLLAGDTIFPGGPGWTATPRDFTQLITSITTRVLTLPDDVEIHPGHGLPTTVRLARQEYAGFASRPHPAGLCGDVTWAGS
jgi:glyoxylase-like metal-dependent hydrolase (beta-lactamase superfamily II)